MPDGPRWHVPPDAVFHWRHWDNEHILFHAQSGDTHRLNDLSLRALEVLGQTARTTDELAADLASELAAPAPANFAASIASLVDEFRSLGLVTASQPNDR